VCLELEVAEAGRHSGTPPKNFNIDILAQAIIKPEANPFPYRITNAVPQQFHIMGHELPVA